jgi:hypothetical protein
MFSTNVPPEVVYLDSTHVYTDGRTWTMNLWCKLFRNEATKFMKINLGAGICWKTTMGVFGEVAKSYFESSTQN